MIERAMKHTKSNMSAARFLGCSYPHYKQYAKLYKNEEGQTLFEAHLNRQGRGISKHLYKKKDLTPIMDILEGRVDIANYSPKDIKERLIHESLIAEECNSCGFNERRVVDYKVPLILNFIDYFFTFSNFFSNEYAKFVKGEKIELGSIKNNSVKIKKKSVIVKTHAYSEEVTDSEFQKILNRHNNSIMPILFIDNICGKTFGHLFYRFLIMVAKSCNCTYVLVNALNETPYLRANFKFITGNVDHTRLKNDQESLEKHMYMIVSVNDLENYVKNRDDAEWHVLGLADLGMVTAIDAPDIYCLDKTIFFFDFIYLATVCFCSFVCFCKTKQRIVIYSL